jgi:hypothetical protein
MLCWNNNKCLERLIYSSYKLGKIPIIFLIFNIECKTFIMNS